MKTTAKILSVGLGLLIVLIGFNGVLCGVHFPTTDIIRLEHRSYGIVSMIYAFEKFDGRSEG